MANTSSAAIDEGVAPLREQILDLSRQSQIGQLSPWFSAKLNEAIQAGYFPTVAQLGLINEGIAGKLVAYREEAGISAVVLGMSGGVDSALTAAIFKRAGWQVTGVTMPIHQEPSETERGIEACRALGIEHRHIDLSDLYDATLAAQSVLDKDLSDTGAEASKHTKIRRGNVRARVRMITLYNLASKSRALVGSTDNLSELGAGFWTLHGDVGDLSPIQSLLKSWEVPYLARLNGVPESTVRAKPTDGLGIDAGDEAQLGASYLEWDLMTYALTRGEDQADDASGPDARRQEVWKAVMSRMGATWYKRCNPLNIPHPLQDRYALIDSIDRERFVPPSFS